jgi:hypothetical protein
MDPPIENPRRSISSRLSAVLNATICLDVSAMVGPNSALDDPTPWV